MLKELYKQRIREEEVRGGWEMELRKDDGVGMGLLRIGSREVQLPMVSVGNSGSEAIIFYFDPRLPLIGEAGAVALTQQLAVRRNTELILAVGSEKSIPMIRKTVRMLGLGEDRLVVIERSTTEPDRNGDVKVEPYVSVTSPKTKWLCMAKADIDQVNGLGERVVFVDDVVSTFGTYNAVSKLLGAELPMCVVAEELILEEARFGKGRLTGTFTDNARDDVMRAVRIPVVVGEVARQLLAWQRRG